MADYIPEPEGSVRRYFGSFGGFVQTLVVIGALIWGVFEIRQVADTAQSSTLRIEKTVDRVLDEHRILFDRVVDQGARLQGVERRVERAHP